VTIQNPKFSNYKTHWLRNATLKSTHWPNAENGKGKNFAT